jgi:hypothetical protein
LIHSLWSNLFARRLRICESNLRENIIASDW